MYKTLSKYLPLFAGAILLAIALYLALVPNITVTESRQRGDFEKITEFTVTEKEAEGTPLGMVQEYRMTLDPFQSNSTPHLAFYARHQYVRVWIGEELVYALMPSGQNRIGKTVGLNWVMVHLHSEDVGKEVLVEIIPVYTSHADRSPQFFLGSELGVYSQRLKEDLPQIVLSIVSLLIGFLFAAFGIGRLLRGKQEQGLAALGFFACLMGIWRLTDIRFAAFIFPDHPVLLAYLSIATLMMCMIPLCIYEARKQKDRRIVYGYSIATALVCLVQILLQLTGRRDFRETLTWSHVMIVAGVACIIMGAIVNRRYLKDETKFDKLLPLIFILGVMTDVGVYYGTGSSNNLFFSVLSIVLFVGLSGGKTIYNYLHQEKLLAQKEVELTEARVAVTISQIQPHFLYNALNSIAELCIQNPDQARTATVDFAEYLRVNLKSIQTKTVVPFAEELAHIRRYLDLEKMRFDERLNIILDIQATDFVLPQLSIQPLIENAVKHGVGQKEEGGTVTVSTREEKDCFLIVIADDGVGFDADEIINDGKAHIGVENSRNRLKTLCGGTIEIKSEKGKGTRATVRIPKEKSQ